MFEFATAGRIVFGRGVAAQAGAITRTLGRRALVVTGSCPDRADFLKALLSAAGVGCEVFSIAGEPAVEEVRLGAVRAREMGAEVVLGIGGGSAVDAAKAVAALATQPEDVMHYLELVGGGQPLDAPPLPVMAMPTTAGTGAEVTRNAVLASPTHGVKASLRHARMLPRVALVDPALAVGCPPTVTAASGMDALTQCLEALVSCRAQAMTDVLCMEGIRRAVRSLERAVADGGDLEAREDMAMAALLSGMALANAGLGAVHGFAAPVGGRFHAPHGAVCAALLTPVWEVNLELVMTAGTEAQRARFATAAALLTGRAGSRPEEALPVLAGLARRLAVPGLSAHGIREEHLEDLASRAAQASSMKGNPVRVPHEALLRMLRGAL